MPLTLRPTGLGSGIEKGPTGLHRVLRRMSGWPHLRYRWWSRQSALVLVDDHHRSHGALGPCGDFGKEAKAQFREKVDVWKVWAKLEEIIR